MDKLVELIGRFQKLKDKTGTSKCSSYTVSFWFDNWSDRVTIALGGYDIGDWNRNTEIETTRKNMLEDFEKKVQEAEFIVENYDAETEWN